jgi:hypothetical protein
MRRLLAVLVLAAAPAAAQTYPEPLTVFVSDFADILDSDAEARITEALVAAREDPGTEIAVVTVGSRRDYGPHPSIESFANGLFNAWGIGDAARNNGILILVAAADREMRIELGAGHPRSWDFAAEEIVHRIMLPAFRAGDLAGGRGRSRGRHRGRHARRDRPHRAPLRRRLARARAQLRRLARRVVAAACVLRGARRHLRRGGPRDLADRASGLPALRAAQDGRGAEDHRARDTRDAGGGGGDDHLPRLQRKDLAELPGSLGEPGAARERRVLLRLRRRVVLGRRRVGALVGQKLKVTRAEAVVASRSIPLPFTSSNCW